MGSLGSLFGKAIIGGVAGKLLGGGSKYPDSPNYEALAKQQGIEDRKTAQEITRWNRPNQYDPMGNAVEWEEGPDGRWTQRQVWSDPVKAQFESQARNAGEAGGLYGDLIQQLRAQGSFEGPDAIKYDPNSGREVADATYEAMMARLRPEQQHSEELMHNKLRLQGLQPGTEAYDRAYQNLLRAHGDVNSLASERATIAGYDEASRRYLDALRGQGQEFGQEFLKYKLPWEQADQAGMMASDRYVPQMPGFSGATGYNPTDIVGGANANYQAAVGKYGAKNDKLGQLLGAGMLLKGFGT